MTILPRCLPSHVGGKLDEGEVPEELRESVQGGSDDCPVEIIHVK